MSEKFDTGELTLNKYFDEIVPIRIDLNLTLEKNWEEDFDHENGQYIQTCWKCEKHFIGHKRRGICKKCAKGDE